MRQSLNRFVPLAIFALAFCLVPLRLYDGLTLMPGDIGDARLNNYFLENIFQFFSGRVPSLWHPTFFYPFPWVLGFSENLFGSAPAYLLARAAGAAPDTAFQIWFQFGYVVNFTAAYYAMRRLGGSRLAAALGAMIFAFALPTLAHAGHAQLHYRFGIPLALVFFAEFLDRHSPRTLTVALAWLVWQFYAGIYIGFFGLVFMALMLLGHVLTRLRRPLFADLGAQISEPLKGWRSLPRQERGRFLLCCLALAALLVLLFFPYLKVKEVYHLDRPWWEISTMLPRLQSYFLSDRSWIWSSPDNPAFKALPMRHEHQMFVGLVPLLLAMAGLFVCFRSGWPQGVKPLVMASGMMILITISIGGESLWRLFYGLPLASAIRAMTRFDQVLLFPVGVLAMIALDALVRQKRRRRVIALSTIIFAVCIAEMALYDARSSKKADWRARIAVAEARLPDILPKDAILFMAQGQEQVFAEELDAMWVALGRGVPTLNGYSGGLPTGANVLFGADCLEVAQRIVSSQNLMPSPDLEEEYRKLVQRVVLVGFDRCDQKALATRPQISVAGAAYSVDDIRHLSYEITRLDLKAAEAVVSIKSTADFSFAAWSSIDRPLRLSWRYRDSLGQPISDWDNRRNLPMDIPPQGQIEVALPLKIPNSAASLEVSMVQEHEFWLHDLGIPTAILPLP